MARRAAPRFRVTQIRRPSRTLPEIRIMPTKSAAQIHCLQINGSPLLQFLRALGRARAEAVMVADDQDKQEYQFHFADDSVLIVNQSSKTARVAEVCDCAGGTCESKSNCRMTLEIGTSAQ